jgi:hypothetical protein
MTPLHTAAGLFWSLILLLAVAVIAGGVLKNLPAILQALKGE